MEELMNLVAASFARHGIDCPASDSQADISVGLVICPGEKNAAVGRTAENSASTAPGPNPIAFPEHNYRKSLQGDPAP
jgi:hypothetical protein